MAKFALAALVLGACSCTPPPFGRPEESPPIPGIEPGDSADRVIDVLGKPDSRETGWWIDGGVAYRMDYQVWYYTGRGRVVINAFDGHVVTSLSDPDPPQGSVDPP